VDRSPDCWKKDGNKSVEERMLGSLGPCEIECDEGFSVAKEFGKHQIPEGFI